MTSFTPPIAHPRTGPRACTFGVTLVALSLAGCGQIPATTGAIRSDGQVQAHTVTGARDWFKKIETGTGNAVNLHLHLETGAKERSVAPAGNLNLVYGDRTGYFAGRSILQVYVRVETSDGDLVKRNLPLLLRRVATENGRVVRYFGGDMPLQLARATTDPVSAEMAFCAADRYGKLTWDSNDGRNYPVRFAVN